MADIDPIFQAGPKPEIEINPTGKSLVGGAKGPGFEDMFTKFLTDVNGMQVQADQSIQKMVSGEIKDVHQVMLAVGEAKVAFNLLLEIRNKVMDAYQEVIKMRG